MSKKSEISHMFTMLLIGLVVVILIVIGTMVVNNTLSSIQDIELADFADKISHDLKEATAKKGTSEYSYSLPSKVGKIIFVDSSNKEALLANAYVQNNPLIEDSIQSDEKKNMFVYSNRNELIKSFYIGSFALGQIADQICTGVGEINVTLGEIKMRITNKPGQGVFMGSECEGIRYSTFEGRFEDTVIPTIDGMMYLKILPGNEKITLRQDVSQQVNYNLLYFPNATMNTTEFALNSLNTELDRIFFNADTPDGSSIKYRIGFKDKDYNSWVFKGPNLSAYLPQHNGYYYTYAGQYITEPEFEYTSVKVEIDFFSNEDKTSTPVFNWLRLSHIE